MMPIVDLTRPAITRFAICACFGAACVESTTGPKTALVSEPDASPDARLLHEVAAEDLGNDTADAASDVPADIRDTPDMSTQPISGPDLALSDIGFDEDPITVAGGELRVRYDFVNVRAHPR